MNNAKRSENIKTQLYKLEFYCDYTGEIISVRIIDLVVNVNAFAKVIVDMSVDINLVDGGIFVIPSQESFYDSAENILLKGYFIEGDENILNILDTSNKIYQGKLKKSKKTIDRSFKSVILRKYLRWFTSNLLWVKLMKL